MSYIRTKEHREKMRLLNLGRKTSEKTRKKISMNHADVSGENNPMWGKKRTETEKEAIRKANTGRKKTKREIEAIRKAHLGHKHSIGTRRKMSLAQRGAKGSGWKGGITDEHRLIRASSLYKQWRMAVFERDNYTCQSCEIKGGYLEANHKKSFSIYPELRFEISNGETLCKPCHKLTENYGWKQYHYA